MRLVRISTTRAGSGGEGRALLRIALGDEAFRGWAYSQYARFVPSLGAKCLEAPEAIMDDKNRRHASPWMSHRAPGEHSVGMVL